MCRQTALPVSFASDCSQNAWQFWPSSHGLLPSQPQSPNNALAYIVNEGDPFPVGISTSDAQVRTGIAGKMAWSEELSFSEDVDNCAPFRGWQGLAFAGAGRYLSCVSDSP